MRSMLKFLMALAVALIAMLAFRALVFTIYTVPGSTLEPTFKAGDRVLVNRWSYGLRTGGGGSLFTYGRLCRRPVARGHWLAIENEDGSVLIGQCMALPGDTVRWYDRKVIVPGRKATCARHDYYSIRHLGLVPEERIIGRVSLVLYNL
jgi:signal peptidase I